jgi:hypothetical protein
METDFGILPMPKYDENQQEWGHNISTVYGRAMSIPTFHDGGALDRIGFMLEAISAESMYTVIPAYHDVQLTGKFVRDDESGEMLDIIFGSIVWDAGLIYDWLGLNKGTPSMSYTTFSGYERNLGMIEAAIQSTVDAFAAIY